MRRNNIAILTSGCIALVASLMPIAEKGSLYVNISHIKGLPLFLYLLPIILIVVSIMSLYRKISNPKPWYLTIGIIGFIISILTVIGGINHIKAFEQLGGGMFGLLMDKTTIKASPSIGLGGILLLVSYFVIIVLGFLYKQSKVISKESK